MTAQYDALRYLMYKHRTTISETARNAGVSRQTLSNWRAGKHEPSIHTLRLLATFFDVDINYFMGENGNWGGR